MKFYIIFTLFIFVYIFSKFNTSYFTEVKEHFQEQNEHFQNSDSKLNKIIENQIANIEYYIARKDTSIKFDVKSRIGKHKTIISHINILMDTLVNHNNKKFREDREVQYIRRYVNSFERKKDKDKSCINYKIEVVLYNTSNYSTIPYVFEFCVKNNKFTINDIKNIDSIEHSNIKYEEKIPVIPSNEKTETVYQKALFKEEKILTDLIEPKKEYNPVIDTPVLVRNCDYLVPSEKKIYDWHPSYIQINDIDHDYDFITPQQIISI